jgi:translation initiation factor 2B subunit (eIF-2B alpha/beta/delta family)
MKKIFLILSLLIVTNTYSQTGKDTTSVSDSTDFICLRDLNNVLLTLSDKVSHNDFVKIQASFQAILDEASKRRKNKKWK